MKRALLPILFFLSSPALLATQIGIYQHGTVVRMHMGECLDPRRGFMAALSGTPQLPRSESCPEYTLVTDKVDYVIVGNTFNQLVPLAETIDFRFRNNELLVRSDDAKHESRFLIKEMSLRSEWEHSRRREEELSPPARHPHDTALTGNRKQSTGSVMHLFVWLSRTIG